MKLARKISNSRPSRIGLILQVLLPLIALGAGVVISRLEVPLAMLLIMGVVGLGASVFMVIYPEFAFYTTIFVSFFIFTVQRALNSDAPIVMSIDVMVWVTFLAVLVRKGVHKESLAKYCKSPIMLLYLIIIFYQAFEYFNPNGGSTELYFLLMRRFATLMLFLYCALQIFTDLKAIDRFFKIWMFLCLICAIYACYEEWIGMPRFELAYIQSDPLRERLAALDGGNYRKSSFLSGCTDFGLLMSATIGMALVFWLKIKPAEKKPAWERVGISWISRLKGGSTGKNKKEKLAGMSKRLMLLNIILMALAMAYSGTRTATLMLIVEVALYLLMTVNERKTAIFGGVFILLFAVIIFGPSYGNGTIRRLKSTFELKSEESLAVRDVNRHYIQPYIYAHPIGGGIGTTGVMFIQYNPGHPLAGFPTDSGLLAIVLEQGIIGLVLQCLCYFVILQQGVYGYYKSRNPKHKIYYLAAIMGLFGYIFAQYAQIAIGQIPGGFLFLALSAVIVRLRQMDKEETAQVARAEGPLTEGSPVYHQPALTSQPNSN